MLIVDVFGKTKMYESLARIDFNLLLALQYLLEEKNTARAAERLYISQSAMSKTLSRLRNTFDDELFYRQSHGLTPTPRALELAENLNDTLESIHRLINPPAYNPYKVKATIRLGVPEPLAVFVIPQLTCRLNQSAPNIILKTQNLTDDYRCLLESGKLDLIIYQRERGESFSSIPVGKHEIICLMRKEHPLRDAHAIDDETFLQADHIVYPTPLVEAEELKVLLEDHSGNEESARILLETSQLSVALDTLANFDALMLCPPGITQKPIYRDLFIEKSFRCRSIRDVTKKIYVTHHVRNTRSKLYSWIIELIRDVIETTPLNIESTRKDLLNPLCTFRSSMVDPEMS